MNFTAGLILIAATVAMIVVARPADGESAPFLKVWIVGQILCVGRHGLRRDRRPTIMIHLALLSAAYRLPALRPFWPPVPGGGDLRFADRRAAVQALESVEICLFVP